MKPVTDLELSSEQRSFISTTAQDSVMFTIYLNRFLYKHMLLSQQ